MSKGTLSAGILLFRVVNDRLEVLIGHPGGPFWSNRHEGAWSIPKGLVDPGEDSQAAALREYSEETGHAPPESAMLELGEVELRSGKRVIAWAVQGTLEAGAARSNLVQMDWPRGSGRMIEFPEIDEFRWCSESEAARLLNPAQKTFVTRLTKMLDHTE